MKKVALLLLCTFSVCSANLVLDLIASSFQTTIFPIRVRTVEELNRRKNESVVLDFIGLIEQYDGYKAEEYNVTTDDGYILGLHRITGSSQSPPAKGKPVILLQHGLYGSSDFLVVLGPEQALAFQLADAGYDVWLGNCRGNTYSRNHTDFEPDEYFSSFWNFRMDEMGTEDLSTFIDFILKETNKKNLTYIGYSMGTTISYILLSTKVEYNEKINLLVSLAPVANFTPPTSRFINTVISSILNTGLVKSELLPQTVQIANFAKEHCSNRNNLNPCLTFFSPFMNLDNFNRSAVPTVLSHVPAGTSYNTVLQYKQFVDTGRFRKFDYGCRFFCKNIAMYNQTEPPDYDVSLITAPSVIFYGLNDVFVKVEDAEYINNKLPNVVAFEEVPEKNFNHMDFVWSNKAKELVYDRLLEILSKYITYEL